MPRGRKAGGRRRGRPSLLASTSTAELRRELERRHGMLEELVRQRDALNSELEELQSAFGGPAPTTSARRGPGRPKGSRNRTKPAAGRQRRAGRGANKVSLVPALQQTLSGKTLSVAEAAEQVKKNGYKTKSANFRTIVNQALIANPDVFKKVARGEYTAR